MNKNDYNIRLERKEEYREVETLVREAFWNVYRPGCLEHYVLHRLRNDSAFIKDLDFVILYGTSGKGDVGMAAFTGGARFVPGEATDGHLEGTASVSVQSTPVWIEDKYTVTVVEDALGYPSEITLASKQ